MAWCPARRTIATHDGFTGFRIIVVSRFDFKPCGLKIFFYCWWYAFNQFELQDYLS